MYFILKYEEESYIVGEIHEWPCVAQVPKGRIWVCTDRL